MQAWPWRAASLWVHRGARRAREAPRLLEVAHGRERRAGAQRGDAVEPERRHVQHLAGRHRRHARRRARGPLRAAQAAERRPQRRGRAHVGRAPRQRRHGLPGVELRLPVRRVVLGVQRHRRPPLRRPQLEALGPVQLHEEVGARVVVRVRLRARVPRPQAVELRLVARRVALLLRRAPERARRNVGVEVGELVLDAAAQLPERPPVLRAAAGGDAVEELVRRLVQDVRVLPLRRQPELVVHLRSLVIVPERARVALAHGRQRREPLGELLGRPQPELQRWPVVRGRVGEEHRLPRQCNASGHISSRLTALGTVPKRPPLHAGQ